MGIPTSYPHGRQTPRLTDRQRWNLAAEILTNAVVLRDEAILLADAGDAHLQRAAFLAQASLEEVLKAKLCLTSEPATDEEWDRFWRTFRDHRSKLALLEEVCRGSPDDFDEAVRMLRTFRERMLYVDVSPWGNPMTPDGIRLSRESVARSIDVTNSALGGELERLREAEPPKTDDEEGN